MGSDKYYLACLLACRLKTMRLFLRTAMFMLAATLTDVAAANFTGVWSNKICTKGRGKPCESTEFLLIHKGNRICGDHTFMTANAGRMNEGFPGSVRGTVIGNAAVLAVTSGRNNAIVLGKATLAGNILRWETLEYLTPGEPEGDALIYGKGLLKHIDSSVSSKLQSACQ